MELSVVKNLDLDQDRIRIQQYALSDSTKGLDPDSMKTVII